MYRIKGVKFNKEKHKEAALIMAEMPEEDKHNKAKIAVRLVCKGFSKAVAYQTARELLILNKPPN